MKAVKRTSCECGYNNRTTEGKADKNGFSAKLKCPKCGGALKLSSQWYARGQINGKQIFQPCGPKKADADAYIASCLLAVRSGSVIPGQEKDISWADAVENCNGWWDRDVERGKMRSGTREHYRYQVIALEKHFFGASLLTITRASVEEFIIDMGKTHAPATVAHAVKALKRMYSMHLENLNLEENPRPKLMEKAFIIEKIELPAVNNEKTASCTEVDLQAVLSAIQKGKGKRIDKQRLRLAIMMGVGMLMRPANINALEWSEIDFEGGVLRIPKEKMKGKRDFEQPIPGPVLDELRSWRIKCELKSRWVFPSPSDPDEPVKRMSKAITNWIERAGLNPEGVNRHEKVTPYVLTRHTGATQLYEESGENLEMVSKTAAHADSRITRQRYVKNRVEYAKRTVVPIQEAMIKRMVGG